MMRGSFVHRMSSIVARYQCGRNVFDPSRQHDPSQGLNRWRWPRLPTAPDCEAEQARRADAHNGFRFQLARKTPRASLRVTCRAPADAPASSRSWLVTQRAVRRQGIERGQVDGPTHILRSSTLFRSASGPREHTKQSEILHDGIPETVGVLGDSVGTLVLQQRDSWRQHHGARRPRVGAYVDVPLRVPNACAARKRRR
jgi:hypothetical protein